MFDSLANSEGGGIPMEDAFHVGKVVINNDPDKIQRIKVTIPGILDNEDHNSLPWVGPIHPSGFGMNEHYGVVRVPMVGSLVVVKFQGGDVHHGLYVGYVPTTNFAKGLPAKLTTNYPHRVGYIDPMGTIVYTDVTTGEMSIWHCSGSQFTIEPSGPLLRIVSNIDITGNIHLKGNITMEGNTTQQGNTAQTGNVDISGNQSVSGNVTVGGNESVGGAVSAGGAITGASGSMGGVSVEGHTHTDSRGGGTSGPH